MVRDISSAEKVKTSRTAAARQHRKTRTVVKHANGASSSGVLVTCAIALSWLQHDVLVSSGQGSPYTEANTQDVGNSTQGRGREEHGSLELT